MDSRFLMHNTHLDNPETFQKSDPQLRLLTRQKYIYHPPLLETFPLGIPGIYTLTGGRQIGKSTLLKQWMALLLKNRIEPQSIAFLSGELIDDHHSLWMLLQQQINEMPDNTLLYIIIDEISYIQHWDKIIKYAADSGVLENTVLMLTGSDSILIQEARMRFPGRRGKSSAVDFHLYPLTFQEVLKLKKIKKSPESLSLELDSYLQHGGYLTAINELAATGHISSATLMTYSDWIRGDMLKRGKQEHYLKEILGAILKRYTSQVSWQALSRDLSIDHPKTIADYAAALESMDVMFIQPALLEDKLVAAPKKPRKLFFNDPFIFHAIQAWLNPVSDPYQQQIKKTLEDTEKHAQLIESCVVTHFHRFYPTYYIKAEGEVDIAYIKNKRFYPIEIKWTTQLHPKSLKQILKYSNAEIWAKTSATSTIQGIPVFSLPLKLSEM